MARSAHRNGSLSPADDKGPLPALLADTKQKWRNSATRNSPHSLFHTNLIALFHSDSGSLLPSWDSQAISHYGSGQSQCEMSFYPSMVARVYTLTTYKGGTMNKVMGLAIALISFLSFAAISNAGETKAKMEKAKGEVKGEMEEAKGEVKALKEETKGNDVKAAGERAKGNVKGTVEKGKGEAKALKENMKD
jgi:hypothetical protein